MFRRLSNKLNSTRPQETAPAPALPEVAPAPPPPAEPVSAPLQDADLRPFLQLLNENSQPNLTALRAIANNVEPLSFGIKQLGYSLARQMAAALSPPEHTVARHVGLSSSLSTQKAIESDWVAHWCKELRIPVVFHRKIWELCFVLQGLYERGLIREGARGLGFGCGEEPLPSYLAANGVRVTATDLAPADSASKGWIETGQHASGPDQAFMSHLVTRERFDQLVEMRYVDMNHIPESLSGYDFCWSICALEHLGSIRHGLDFIESSLATLRPGGVAIHTTEFNIRNDGPTIDNWGAVAFQRHHMEALAARLEAQGHRVVPFDFNLGDGPLDKFVDIPPYHQDLPPEICHWLGDSLHLKLAIDGIIVTCVGIIVEKAAQAVDMPSQPVEPIAEG